VTSSIAVLSVVDGDPDADGVPDSEDRCPGAASNEIVDDDGCSIAQLAPCEGPSHAEQWKNLGDHVRAVAAVVSDFLAQGLIGKQRAHDVLRAAALSDCGKPQECQRDGRHAD
jgi:hypothetical protein